MRLSLQASGKARQLDVPRLRKNFADIAAHGDEVALFFYSDLFIRHPELRDLFPVSMAAQRGHLLDALGRIVACVDRTGELGGFLEGLGRDHRKFGVAGEHYPMVGESLVATLEFFSGDRWSAELAADWRAAFSVVARVMAGAAAADEGRGLPAFWRGVVGACERRGPDVAVLQVRPEPALEFVAGQSVAVCSPRRPRLWRYYSIANAPRPDGSVEFHVRLVDGGQVSGVLTDGQVAGEELWLGPPAGALRLDGSDREVVMVAGSTGLAPLKALCEQLAADQGPGGRRRVRLFFSARTGDELYDLPALEKMAAEHPWLTITPTVTADPRYAGERGPLAEVVARGGDWAGAEAYLAGPSLMVEAVAARLTAAGTPRERIHIEDFGWSEP